MQRRLLAAAIGAVAIVAVPLAACGDDDDSDGNNEGNATTPAEQSGALGMTAIDPSARLTFEGEEYRLAWIDNMFDGDQLDEAGSPAAVNIETGGTVFTKAGETGAVYTFSQHEYGGDGAWLRWELAGG